MPAFFHWVGSLREPDGAARRAPVTYRGLWRRVADVAGTGAAHVDCIGNSSGGEPLWAITVGPGRPDVLVLAGLHAMEHVGPATAVALIERAAAGEGVWPRRSVTVVPIANPDGFVACERMVARGGRRFLRRNARGVDLNRNFAVGWDDRYVLNRVVRPVFAPGPAPLSEPETRAIDRLAARLRPRVAASLHAFGEVIYWPFASTSDPPPDADAFERIARRMAAAQPGRGYKCMQLGRRSRLFKACGAEIDHLYARYGTLAFLIEIGAGPRLRAPATWLSPYRWFTPPEPQFGRDVRAALAALDALGACAE